MQEQIKQGATLAGTSQHSFSLASLSYSDFLITFHSSILLELQSPS